MTEPRVMDWAPDAAEAMLALHRQIVARWGNIPDVLCDLNIRTLDSPAPQWPGKILVAWPKGTLDLRAADVLAVYYGEIPLFEPAEGEAR